MRAIVQLPADPQMSSLAHQCSQWPHRYSITEFVKFAGLVATSVLNSSRAQLQDRITIYYDHVWPFVSHIFSNVPLATTVMKSLIRKPFLKRASDTCHRGGGVTTWRSLYAFCGFGWKRWPEQIPTSIALRSHTCSQISDEGRSKKINNCSCLWEVVEM